MINQESHTKALELACRFFNEVGDLREIIELMCLDAKDAARYRAIRNGLVVDPDNSGIVVSLIDDFGGETLHGEKADQAIDAAIEAEVRK